jgi:hypothetical protein
MALTHAQPTHTRCLCRACGEVFSTVSNFDKHRRGMGADRHCVDPTTVGLRITGQDHGGWWAGVDGGNPHAR